MTQKFLTRIALMAAMTTAAFAQDRHYNFTSPEPFVANGAKMPAGEYRLSPLKGVPSAYALQAINGSERAYIPLLHQREIGHEGSAKMLLACGAKGCEFAGVDDPVIGISFRSKAQKTGSTSTIRMVAITRAAVATGKK